MLAAMESPGKIRQMVAKNEKDAAVVNTIEIGRSMVIGCNAHVTINFLWIGVRSLLHG